MLVFCAGRSDSQCWYRVRSGGFGGGTSGTVFFHLAANCVWSGWSSRALLSENFQSTTGADSSTGEDSSRASSSDGPRKSSRCWPLRIIDCVLSWL